MIYRVPKPPHVPYFVSIYCDHLGASVTRFDVGKVRGFYDYIILGHWHNLGPSSFKEIIEKSLELSEGCKPKVLMNDIKPLLSLFSKEVRAGKFTNAKAREIELLDNLTTFNSLLAEERVIYKKDFLEITRALEDFDINAPGPIVMSLLHGIGKLETDSLQSELRIDRTMGYTKTFWS